jgi:hypothetical protein
MLLKYVIHSFFVSSLPIGIVAGAATVIVGTLQRHFPLKWLIVTAQITALVGVILLSFGDSPQRYFPFVFPGFILVAFGIAMAYILVKYVIFSIFCLVTYSLLI